MRVSYLQIDQSSYEQTRRQKLSDIQETRSRQAATLQQQIQNPQSQQMNMMQQMQMQGIPPAQNQVQFHFNPNANPQLQQPMQVSGIPMQQQMMHPQAQLQMGNQTMGMHQPPQNLHPQMSQSQGQNAFTMEENQTIQRIAQSLAQSASPDQLNVIRHNLQNMNPEQRQALAMQGTDPVTFFFRNHAIKKFIEHRAKLSAQRAHPGMPTTGNGLVPQHSRPASQHVIPIQSQQQIMDSFAPSMDQIRGQQQDALRSQEAGQVVVPASSSQSIVEQRGGVRGTPQQQPNGQLGANRTMQNAGQGPQQPSQYWGNPQMQQSGIPQTPHMAVPQNQNFGNNAVQPPLQGQVGGLGNSMGRLPQQNPAMPNLNQGLNPPPQPQNMWGQPRAGQPGQPKEPSGGNTQQPIPPQGVASAEPPESGQQRLKMMMNELPLNVRQHLAGLPEEGRKEWLMNFRQRQQAQHQQRVAQQHTPKLPESTPVSLQNNQTGSQMQQPQNVSNQSVMNNPLGVQQAATPQQPPPLANAARGQSVQVTRNQQIVQNRHAVNLANNTLTEEQARWMDQHNFPAAILNHGSTLSQQLPQDIKTWGQLKSWVTQHDSSLPPGSLAKLRGLQGLHYQNLARHREQQFGQKPAPTAPMVNLQRHALPQPTSQEIQALRARLPDPLKGLSDDDVSAMVIKQRQQDLIKLSQPQQNMSQPQQNYLANVQRHYQPVTQQQLSTTSSHPNQAQQPPPGPRPQPHHTQRQQPSKEQTTKQSNTNRNATQTTNQGQSSSKGVKRNSNDDVVEVPNPNAANQDTLSQLSKVAQASTQSKASSKPSEPTSSLVQDQKSINDAQRRVQPNQRSQASATQSGIHDSNDKGLSDNDRRIEESAKRDQRLRQLMKEISQNTPSRQPVAMNEQTRAKMVQRLRDAKEMVQRLAQSLPIFFRMSGDENTTRDLIRTVSVISVVHEAG